MMSLATKGWSMIVVGGIFQVIATIAMDYSDSLRNLGWDVVVMVFFFLSIWCLSYAMKTKISLSTSYTVWMGLGVVGTICVSVLLGLETITWPMAFFLALIIGGVVGLKMTPTETKSQ